MVLHSLRFNFDAARSRLAALARATGISGGDHDAASSLVEAINGLAATLGTPTTLSELGLPTGQFAQITQDVLGDPQTYWNPRAATALEIEAWLETAWESPN
jgi:alcohol dehydrogenase class IV